MPSALSDIVESCAEQRTEIRLVEMLHDQGLLLRPMLSVQETAFLLDDPSEEHITHLVEEGKLKGVNIAVDYNLRRLIRVCRWSVERLILPTLRQISEHPTFEDMLPHTRPTLLLREVAAFLACSDRHVENLEFEGPSYTGAGARQDRMRRIYRESLLEFLAAREVI